MKRVIIVYPFVNMDSTPCLMNSAVLFARNGYGVDIFTLRNENNPLPVFKDPIIHVFFLNLPRKEWPALLRFLPRKVYDILHLLYLQYKNRHSPFACIFGVDPIGLVKAQAMRRWIKVPLVYFSLELLFSYEIVREEDRKLKLQERILSSQAAFVITQDDERGAALAKENSLQVEKIITLPNSILGLAEFRRSDYLRQKYNLSRDVKIILCAGSIRYWACLHQLIYSTQNWPSNWVLICHGKVRINESRYLNILKDLAKSGKVIFSTEPVPSQEYPQLVQSADVGVAFYQPTLVENMSEDNLRYMGLSSGKLAYYLWAGIPVLINNFPSTNKLIAAYQCGEVVEDPTNTRQAIQRIFKNYDLYSQNAVRFYNAELNFGDHFEKILLALKDL